MIGGRCRSGYRLGMFGPLMLVASDTPSALWFRACVISRIERIELASAGF